jgi:hypothetical protein
MPGNPISREELFPRLDWQDKQLLNIMLVLQGNPTEPEKGLIGKVEAHSNRILAIQDKAEGMESDIKTLTTEKDQRSGSSKVYMGLYALGVALIGLLEHYWK